MMVHICFVNITGYCDYFVCNSATPDFKSASFVFVITFSDFPKSELLY